MLHFSEFINFISEWLSFKQKIGTMNLLLYDSEFLPNPLFTSQNLYNSWIFKPQQEAFFFKTVTIPGKKE